MKMEFKEAVELAKAGNERGFGFLYENTYKNKYHLALRYMKNPDAAEDVMQDAYLKAFSNLDQLKNADAFAGWFGMIVTNTAKNALVKKNPILFSEMISEDEDIPFEYLIEDDNIENQPELSYTRQESQQLMHELIDSLSDEQRICILMFHMEGASIKDIATALNCTDNTVKSRLNYGRRNLKLKIDELQKKGINLYGLAPLPLLLLLLRSDRAALEADGSIEIAGLKIANNVFSKLPVVNTNKNFSQQQSASTQQPSASSAVKGTSSTIKNAAKTGFFHTVAGKVTAVTVGLAIIGGGAYIGYTKLPVFNSDTNKTVAVSGTVTPVSGTVTPVPTEAPGIEAPIIETPVETPVETPAADNSAANGQSINDIYQSILLSIQNREAESNFNNMSPTTGNYSYFLQDLNGDGIPELVVGAEIIIDVFYGHCIRVYSCEQTSNGYQLKRIQNVIDTVSILIPSDGNGLYGEYVSRCTGVITVYRIRLENDSLIGGNATSSAEINFLMSSGEYQQFLSSNPPASWRDISDLSGLQ